MAHGALLAAHGDRAGADQQQLHEVAPVQRKLFHLLLAHLLRQRRAVRVQSHGLGIDFDSGRNCARLQDHVNARALVHGEDHAGGQRFLKSSGFDRYAVASRVEGGHCEITRGSGLGVSYNPRVRVGYIDFGIGHHRTGIVGDGSEDGSVGAALTVQQTRRRNYQQQLQEITCHRGHVDFLSLATKETCSLAPVPQTAVALARMLTPVVTHRQPASKKQPAFCNEKQPAIVRREQGNA